MIHYILLTMLACLTTSEKMAKYVQIEKNNDTETMKNNKMCIKTFYMYYILLILINLVTMLTQKKKDPFCLITKCHVHKNL